MTNAEAREAFIVAREEAQAAEPINLPVNTPVVMGGARYRAVYDGLSDSVVLVTEDEWRRGLEKARAHRAADEVRARGGELAVVKTTANDGTPEFYVPLRGFERLRVAQGGREWVVFYDIAVGEFVCQPVSETIR